MTTELHTATGARTGEQFLDGLRQGGREIWLRGQRITHPLDHPELRAGALSLASVFDLQHEHADEMLAPSPDDPDRLINVTHLIPRAKDGLERRRRAFELVAAMSGGTMGRTPDYLNVTFACFAGRSDVWARRDNEQGASNLVAYQAQMRDCDLSTTHALMNPQVDRSKPEAEQAMGQVALHKISETSDAIVVRGARMLATLAPFADELLVYPGSDIRPQDGRYALSFAIPIATPGLRFICRDSYSKQRDPYDYPLSSRFDEMDAVVIFDDVEIPRERVFLDGDTVGYSEVITDTGWRGHIMHPRLREAVLRARDRPRDRQHDRGRAVRPHPGEARPDLGDERAGPQRDRVGRGGRDDGRGRRHVPG
jgi:4-hydroxyphenylacetate 3-monooxygenase